MTTPQASSQTSARTYHIDFALIILTGNITRYKIIRPLVERDPSIVARWYPIRTWFDGDPLRILPGAVRVRLRHFLDSLPAYMNTPADAIIMHAFETYYLYPAIQQLLGRKSILINNPDGDELRKHSWLHRFAVKHTDLFIPWSNWGAQILKQEFPEIPDEKIVVLHPGINLAEWPMRTPGTPSQRFKILFVGGDFLRKGGDTLLDAFENQLQDTCDLTIATQSANLPTPIRDRIAQMQHVTLHLDLTSNSPMIKQIYRETDCFVMPTKEDSSSWVAIEALATGIPVIISNSGGIPDIVIDGETGFIVQPSDPTAIVAAVRRIQYDPELTNRLIRQGRSHIEAHFNAEKNTEYFMSIVKALIDNRRERA
jgi:glycosyltransferase involved in cell wall biosynthesis